MSVILERGEDFVYVRYVCTEPDICVDGGHMVRPGESYDGLTYEELRAVTGGSVDLAKIARKKRSLKAGE